MPKGGGNPLYQPIRFYWLCIKDAWQGSFAIANGWSGLWGPFLIFSVFWYRGETLTLPDKLDSYALLFTLATLGSTWLALFLVRLCLAPARLHQRLEAEIARLSSGTTSATTGKPVCRNISAVQLVPSGDEMSLVITPSRGGIEVSLFVDVAHHNPGSGWPKPQRIYLGKVKLLAANHRLSVTVMDRRHEDSTPPALRGWLWNIIKADGTPSGTRLCSLRGKERATFIFIGPDGDEQKFPMLLLYSDNSPTLSPSVVTFDDLAT